MKTFFVIIAIATAAVLAIVAYRAFFQRRPASGHDKLPLTPLQKRAWLGLAIGLAASGTVAALLLERGPTQFFAESTTRFTFYGILAAGGLLWLLAYWLTRPPSGVSLDERDREILARAPAIQSGLILLSLAAWMIGLTESYHAEGSIPIVFASLIFWSSWIMHLLGLSLGVLFGYWKAQSDGEG